MAWFEQPARGALYGVYDAARDDSLLPALSQSGLHSEMLLDEREPGTMRAVAPHLVHLELDHPFTQRCIRDGWASRWAIFLRAPTHLQGVNRQLRRLLIAQDPQGRRLLFRFYDPRVLRVYLPTCNAEELKTFFGPIEAFYAFRDDEDVVDVFTLRPDRLLDVQQRPGPAQPASDS